MDDIVAHYQDGRERERLLKRFGKLEFERTRRLIRRYLSDGSRRIVDVGGGPGLYAEWLVSLGHEVHLVDLSPEHVQYVRSHCRGIASATVGDARDLKFADESADAVLLLGPLYHLTERADRVAAITEAHRVIRPGGVVFVAVISRFASLLDGLTRGYIDDPVFVDIMQGDLSEGQHRNHTGDPRYFTTAFFHRPEELREEMEAAGLIDIDIVAVEGPGWLALDFDARWEDGWQREQILSLIEQVERAPELLGLSFHILAIGSK